MKRMLFLFIILSFIINIGSIKKSKFKNIELTYYDNIRFEQVEPVKEMDIDTSKYFMIESPIFLGKTNVTFLNKIKENNDEYFYIVNNWIKAHHQNQSKEYNLDSISKENSSLILVSEKDQTFMVLIKNELLNKISDDGNMIYYIYLGGNLDFTVFVIVEIE